MDWRFATKIGAVDSCRVPSESRRVLPRTLPSLLILFAASNAEGAVVYVEAGALTASIAEGLRAEVAGTDIALRPEEADVLVGVRRGAERLDVQVVAASGATILERRVNLESEVAASVRVVVLLIAEALAASPLPEPPIAAPPPPAPIVESPVRIKFGAGFTSSLWREPGTAQLGPYLSATRVFGALQVGLQILFTPCCSVSSQGVVAGSTLLLGGLITAEVRAVEAGAFVLSAMVAAGGAWRHFEGDADVFAPDPNATSPQIHNAFELLARSGPVVGLRFSERFSLRVGLGLELRENRLALVVPPEYPIQGRIDSGFLSPWLDVGLSFELF